MTDSFIKCEMGGSKTHLRSFSLGRHGESLKTFLIHLIQFWIHPVQLHSEKAWIYALAFKHSFTIPLHLERGRHGIRGMKTALTPRKLRHKDCSQNQMRRSEVTPVRIRQNRKLVNGKGIHECAEPAIG